MTPTDLPERRVLRGSRRGTLQLLASAAVLTIANAVLQSAIPRAVREVAGPLLDVFAWISLILLVLLGVVGIAMLVFPAQLTLDPEGFTLTSLGRSHRVRWFDVAGFQVTRLARLGREMVGYTYVAGYEPIRRVRTFNRAVSGFDAALPETYGMSVQELASLMEEWRQARGPGSVPAAR